MENNINNMEINEIKQNLTLANVLHYYNLKPDPSINSGRATAMMHCPFHEDKTPSMQVYYKTHSAFCFSASCKAHGKAIDVIDFIMLKENISKHEALIKCTKIIKGTVLEKPTTSSKVEVLSKIFTYFKNGVSSSPTAKAYLESRNLDYKKIEVGYNTAQFHHGNRKDEQLINDCVKYGLLIDKNIIARTGDKAYQVFGKNCICFALKNNKNEIVSLYFRSAAASLPVAPSVPEAPEGTEAKHFYLKDRSGLYPCYPSKSTNKLILTESIIDAATLLQNPKITSEYSILACYGTNGLNDEILNTIKELNQLSEIIFAFDNDDAGNKATTKYAKQLNTSHKNITISKIELPNKDVNETLIAHSQEIFIELLQNRIILFSPETIDNINTHETPNIITSANLLISTLDTKNINKIIYTTDTAKYYILGGISKQLDNLKVMLQVDTSTSSVQENYIRKSRNRIDLYEDKQVEKVSKEVSEKLQLRHDLVEQDIYALTELLENYRDQEQDKQQSSEISMQNPITPEERKAAITFLKQDKVIKRLNELLAKTGIVGEERNRIFLLLIALSYKMKEPLHALIQGSSGSGKTKIVRQVSDCIPLESVTRFTRISDKALYNYPKHFFKNRLLIIEDVDGLSEEAELAFRELQSSGELRSSVSIKLENGNITAGEKIVSGPIASMTCTTKGELYEDNMSRVFLIAVDESTEQTKRIINYQNKIASGTINVEEQKRVTTFVQNIIRVIEAKQVVNPFAEKIQLPEEAHKIRRLNDLFQNFIKMVTLINQYKRQSTKYNQLITAIEDIETAIEIMFESIVLKVDELDGSLRQFYEKLKMIVEKKSKQYEFNRFEIREATGLGKTQQHYYLSRLVEMEYIQQNGFANRGYKYKIVHWDNYKTLRDRIKDNLKEQVEQLKINASAARTEHQPNANRTPANE
jgi:DNA primase